MPHAADTIWGGMDKGGGYHLAAVDDRDDRVCMVCMVAFPTGVGDAFYTVYRVWSADADGVRVCIAMGGENTFGLSHGAVADEVRDVHGRVV